MSYKTIVAFLARADGVAQVMDAALPLAEEFDAHLIGMHVSSGVPAVGSIGEQVPPDIIEQYAKFMLEDAAAIEDAFSKAVKGAEVKTEWRRHEPDVLGTDFLQTICEHARFADIVVMGQPGIEQRVGDLTPDIIMAAGRPVIVIPKNGAAMNLMGKIVIAWDGSREAARAVFDSLALLKKAQSVSVVTVQKRGGRDAAALGGGELALSLARHGVTAEAVVLEGGASAGEAIIEYVSRNNCDLIVMGCYGHSRLRERLFGGATRRLLEEMPAPLLMSH